MNMIVGNTFRNLLGFVLVLAAWLSVVVAIGLGVGWHWIGFCLAGLFFPLRYYGFTVQGKKPPKIKSRYAR